MHPYDIGYLPLVSPSGPLKHTFPVQDQFNGIWNRNYSQPSVDVTIAQNNWAWDGMDESGLYHFGLYNAGAMEYEQIVVVMH